LQFLSPLAGLMPASLILFSRFVLRWGVIQ